MTAPAEPPAALSARDLLRHALATVAYRAGKVLRDTPEGFAEFRAAADTRKAARILAHMGDLMDWGLHLAEGEHVWNDSPPLEWDAEVDRFFTALAAFDARLADPDGRLARQIADGRTPEQIVAEFYLRALSREPSPAEREQWQRELTAAATPAERRQILEDFVWALCTCREFVTNH